MIDNATKDLDHKQQQQDLTLKFIFYPLRYAHGHTHDRAACLPSPGAGCNDLITRRASQGCSHILINCPVRGFLFFFFLLFRLTGLIGLIDFSFPKTARLAQGDDGRPWTSFDTEFSVSMCMCVCAG